MALWAGLGGGCWHPQRWMCDPHSYQELLSWASAESVASSVARGEAQVGEG